MKAHSLNTAFNFGRYEGRTLEDVFAEDPAYVEKCMVSVDEFVIEERSLAKLMQNNPETELGQEAIDNNLTKLDTILDVDDDDTFLRLDDDTDANYEDLEALDPTGITGRKRSHNADDEFGIDADEEDWGDMDDYDDSRDSDNIQADDIY